jgi:hypothetical protein
MGRLLGLGFLFGARDDGATRTANELAAGMDRVSESVAEASRSSSALSRLGNAINSLNFLQLDRIGDSLENMAERAGINASSTGIESFGAEFSNTFRRATVGLGPFREEVDRVRGEISGLAYSLDVDANDMIAAVTNVARSGNRLEDFGISMRAVAGAIQSNIISGDALGRLLADLSEGYELGTEGSGRLIDRVTAIGEAFGEGAAAVRRLPEVIAAADPVLARFTNLSIEDVTESITRLSVAMSRGLGMSFEDASSAATQLFTSLSEARGGITDLVTGVGSEFPELATELGIAGGDIDEAMQMILSDPLTFAHRMRDMMATMDRGSPAFARLQSSISSLPEAFRFLVLGGEEAGAALDAASAPIGEFEGAFNRMARSGAGTTRTFAESMERLEDAFRTRLNSMTSITTSEVLGRQRDAYRRLGDTLRDFAGRGGPLGFLTNAFLNVRRYGIVHGLLPMLEDGLGNAFPGLARKIEEFSPLVTELGEGFLEAATSAGPFVLAMSQLGVFRGVSQALTMVNGAFGGLFGTIIRFAGPVAVIAGAGYLLYENWELVSELFQDMGPIVRQGLQDARDHIDAFLTEAVDFTETIEAWITNVDWVAVGGDIAKFFGDAFEVAQSALTDMFSTQFWAEVFDPSSAVGGWTQMLGDILGNTVGHLPGVISDIFSGMFAGSSGFGALADGIAEAWLMAMEGIFGPNPRMRAMFESGGAMGMLTDFLDFAMSVFEPMGEIFADVIVPAGQIWWETVTEIGSAFWELWTETLGPVLDMFREWWRDTYGGEILPESKEGFRSTGDAFRRMWRNTIRPALLQFLELSITTAQGFQEAYVVAFRNFAEFAIRSISQVIIGITTLRTNFETARNVLAAGWQLIGARIRRFFTQPILEARDYFMTLFENIDMSLGRIRLTFINIAHGLVESLQRAFMALPSVIRATMPGIEEGFSSALTSIDGEIERQGRELRAQEDALRRDRDARHEEITRYDAEVTRAEDALAAARDERRNRLIAEIEPIIHMRDRLIEGLDTFSDRFGAALLRMRERLGDLTGEARDDAEVVASVIEDARGASVALERAVEEGRISSDRASALGEALMNAATGGDTEAIARVREEVGDSPPVRARSSEETPTRASTVSRTAARREASAAADAAEDTRRARDTAREMIVSSFGREAVQQLARAMGPAPAAAGGRRARGSTAGGTGMEDL